MSRHWERALGEVACLVIEHWHPGKAKRKARPAMSRPVALPVAVRVSVPSVANPARPRSLWLWPAAD